MDMELAKGISIILAAVGILLKIIFDYSKGKEKAKEQSVSSYEAVMTTIVKDVKSILIKLTENTSSIGVVVTSTNIETKQVNKSLEKLTEKSDDRAEKLNDIHGMTSRDHERIQKTENHLDKIAELIANGGMCSYKG